MTTPAQCCNNTSVGILVIRGFRLLLIERRKPPYGWAPPAGHVDDGETYEQAVKRELAEEVGLRASSVALLLSKRYQNKCRRLGGDYHNWQVFQAWPKGTLTLSEQETRAARWVTRYELAHLTEIGIDHMACGDGPEEWRRRPGLEPVWIDILVRVRPLGPFDVRNV